MNKQISNNNSDEKKNKTGVNDYENYIENEIIKETYLKNNTDMEKVIGYVRELNKIDPPSDKNIDEKFNEFCQKYHVHEKTPRHKTASKRIFALAAAISVLLISSIMVIGNKLNMFVPSGYTENQSSYSKGSNIPLDEAIESNEQPEVTVRTMDELLRLIPFTPLTIHYLPDGCYMDTIQVNKLSDDFIDIIINYNDSDGENGLVMSINYSSNVINEELSKQYEEDYSINDSITIMGQECRINSDDYNNNCNFAFEQSVYSINSSKKISELEFRKILESIDF